MRKFLILALPPTDQLQADSIPMIVAQFHSYATIQVHDHMTKTYRCGFTHACCYDTDIDEFIAMILMLYDTDIIGIIAIIVMLYT